MKAYTQMMGGKHRIVMFAPAGQRIALLTAYSSKASAHQALCTLGFEPMEEPAPRSTKYRVDRGHVIPSADADGKEERRRRRG